MSLTDNIKKWYKSIEGDKVIFLIFFFLTALSVVLVLSSTSLEKDVVSGTSNRFEIFKDQIVGVILGFFCLFIIYKCIPTEFFIKLGIPALLVSLFFSGMLFQGHFTGWLVDSKSEPRAVHIGISIFVCEVLKVSLLYYLAWALERYTHKKTSLINWWASRSEKGTTIHKILSSGLFKRTLMFYLPILFCCGCLAIGGTSSALILGFMCYLVLCLGLEGGNLFKLLGLIVAFIILAFGLIMIIPESSLPSDSRLPTIKVRMKQAFNKEEIDLRTLHGDEYKEELRYLQQIEGCKIAIQNGGFIGRGTGNSQQKYVVPVIYADYVFSFICEEYGLLGAFFVIFAYLTILARGRIIARGLKKDSFEQLVFVALVVMITLQAFFHIAINLDLGPTTGQNLPLLSYGKSAFVCMSIAFGIILNLSKEAARAVQRESAEAAPIVAHTEHFSEETQDTINDLNDFSNDEII